MSDESSSSAAAVAAASASGSGLYDGDERNEAATTANELAERKKRNRIAFNRKRGELLDDLLRNLDILIYAELSAIYHMDCFFFRFCIRAIVQFLFLTPKPSFFPETPPNRPYIGAIFGSNILCIILHLAFSAPTASDATRGYLHGGLAMDFIGQKGPSSKIHLILLDLLVLALQLTHLAGLIARRKLTETAIKPIAEPSPNPATAAAAIPRTHQTVDDEERGVRRSAEDQQRDDVELHTLNPAGQAAASSADDEVEEQELEEQQAEAEAETGAPERSPPPTDAHIFDAFNSGQIVLADLNLPRTVAEQFWAYRKITWESTQTDPARFLRQRLARGGLRWRFDTQGF